MFLLSAPAIADKLQPSFPGDGDVNGDVDGDGDGTPDANHQGMRELEEAIPGVPGTDYPLYSIPPQTSFVCDGYIDGYYADSEARCQVYHVCSSDGNGGLNKHTFLCPNGTLFNQQFFVCDWWFNVDCSQVGY